MSEPLINEADNEVEEQVVADLDSEMDSELDADLGAEGDSVADTAAAQRAADLPTFEPVAPKTNYRAGFVALVGQPNAGKSTLLNAILDEKVSIVTDKPQTTRNRVTGILNLKEAQVIFVDAPGTLKSATGINKFLQDEVTDVIAKADVVCALLAADATEETVKELVTSIRRAGKPWIAIITKRDILGAGTRTPRFFQYLIDEQIPFVSISSLKHPKEAREEVLTRVVPLLPSSPAALYDEELYTTQTLRQLSAELIRETCFEHLRQEIPYGLAVRVVEFKEGGPTIKIGCEIMVEKQNHKGIVIGSKGSMLKLIGTEARKKIEKILGDKVFLEIHVHVNENWTDNPRFMKELGYVVHKD